MLPLRAILTIAAITIFILGSGYIVYNGRPVMDIKTDVTDQIAQTDTTDAENVDNHYTTAEIQTHATKENCWSSINGSVYNLTTWVSRHPGGESPIMALCGNDGSEMFNRVHGSSDIAQKALFLLKIGSLE